MALTSEHSPRTRLLETALRVFHREGFHATGIDRLLAEAKVSKKTLYSHFTSKDELILEVMRLRDTRFRGWLQDSVAARIAQGTPPYLALIDSLAEWVESPTFSGCLFINATAEYGASGNPVRIAAAEHKALVLAFLVALAQQAGAKDPVSTANILSLIKEGIIVSKQVSPACDPIATARMVVTQIL